MSKFQCCITFFTPYIFQKSDNIPLLFLDEDILFSLGKKYTNATHFLQTLPILKLESPHDFAETDKKVNVFGSFSPIRGVYGV